MGDIVERNASEPVRIIGADTTGAETAPVGSSAVGDLFTSDSVRIGGLDKTLVVTTTPTKIQFGASPLANRKVLIFVPDGKILWGYSETTQNIPVFKNQYVIMDITQDVIIWAKALTGSVNVFLAEGA